jgi:hypothetical protein
VKGIEPSSSAWKAVAASTISEVITENETQNRSLNVNRFFHLPQRSNGDAMGVAICRACVAQFSPRNRVLRYCDECCDFLAAIYRFIAQTADCAKNAELRDSDETPAHAVYE